MAPEEMWEVNCATSREKSAAEVESAAAAPPLSSNTVWIFVNTNPIAVSPPCNAMHSKETEEIVINMFELRPDIKPSKRHYRSSQ